MIFYIVDYWITLRLWQYTLLLCERHKTKKNKLPLIAPMLFYKGKKLYDAPKNLWELFDSPNMAKQLLSNDYTLIDLASMSDDQIMKKQHLGMDMLKLWESFMLKFPDTIILDKENGYIYIKKLLWYTDSKVAEKDKNQLNKLILEHLPTEDGEEIMRTIADGYFEKGIEKSIEKRNTEVAIKMLQQRLDIKLISSVTGIPSDELLKLKNKTQLAS